MSNHKSRNPERDQAIVNTFKTGATVAEIAESLGLSRVRVNRILQEQGARTGTTRKAKKVAKPKKTAQKKTTTRKKKIAKKKTK